MATNSKPVLTWIATIMAGTAVAQSSSLTATIHITNQWEIQVPVAVRFSNVSADPVIFIYPSSDGGATYDSTAMASFAVGRVSVGTGSSSIRIPAGQYAFQLLNSGPNTATFMILTAQILDSINNA